MLTLRYRRSWIAASLALVALVIWGSLQTAFDTGGMHGFDKVQHFGTYLFLAAWFTGLVGRKRYWLVVAGLLGLGLLLELGQFAMQAGRKGDPYDMAANTAGVTAGLLLAVAVTGGWAEKVERWLQR
jgi:VanZ family protein